MSANANERIKQLADRAIGSMPYDWIQTHDWNIPDEFLEKFAELIIKECAQVASDYDGAHYVGTAIEKHFGVEE